MALTFHVIPVPYGCPGTERHFVRVQHLLQPGQEVPCALAADGSASDLSA